MTILQYSLFFAIPVIVILGIILYYKRIYSIDVMLPSKCLMDEDCIIDVVRVLQRIITRHSKKVKLNMREVKNISYEAYMVIMAQGEKAFYKGKTVYLKSVPFGRKEVVNVIFGKNKNHTTYHNYTKLEKTDNTPFLQSSKINPKIMSRIELDLKRMKIIDYYEFNTLMTELLGNAIEHGIQERNINWWMYHFRDYRTNTMHIVFVDMGIGIINSYKKAGLPKQYTNLSDEEIIMYALKGKLGSSTKEPNRGRGMPQIKHMIEKKWISDFVLITNTVSLRYINGQFKVKKHPNFVGTYYSWTINKENYLTWKEQSI